MEQWLESVYSDGSAAFVSDPSPRLGETVRVRIRFYEDAPVRGVMVRTSPNGGEMLIEAKRARVRNGLVWYEAELPIIERRTTYQFLLACENQIYFYTQNGITTYLPNQNTDFVLLTDYVQPAWVKNSVFYQIFPDRFCNGDPANDVRDGEYCVQGHPTMRIPWDRPAPSYEEGRCLDFYGGDLRGIQDQIPYFKALGVNALYLNPIFTAPSVHKYDCVDYFHVDPHFGGDEALADLSRALHDNGIRLILDISINHTGSAHRWFNRDCLWFPASEGAYHNQDSPERGYYFFGPDNTYKGWWGIESLPVLNYTSEALRDAVYRAEDSVLKKWLRPPYSIDGWRFDVADVFARNGALQLSHELWPEIRKSIRSVNPQAYILAEDWGDCRDHMQGDEWDSPMNYYGCGRVIRSFLGQPDFFLQRAPSLSGLRPEMTAEELRGRVRQHLAGMPFALWQNQFNLIDSHDISRLHNDPDIHPEEYRGAVMFQFVLIGTPSVYYGDEAAIDGRLHSNEGCRYPMPWDRAYETTERFRFYQRLIRIRRESRALAEGGMQFLYAEGRIFSIARFLGDEILVFVMSGEREDREIHLPLGAVGASEPEGDRDLLDRPLSWARDDRHGIRLRVPAHEAVLFRCKPVNDTVLK